MQCCYCSWVMKDGTGRMKLIEYNSHLLIEHMDEPDIDGKLDGLVSAIKNYIPTDNDYPF